MSKAVCLFGTGCSQGSQLAVQQGRYLNMYMHIILTQNFQDLLQLVTMMLKGLIGVEDDIINED
eukprot:1575647-Ditylum_brightwellii.AAC.1